MSKFERLLKRYSLKHLPRLKEELSWFKSRPSLAEATKWGALARWKEGRKLRHQWRIPNAVLTSAARNLGRIEAKLQRAETFDAIFDLVETSIKGGGIGPLAVYDTALRIGAWRRKLPRRVYLHAGTKTGANAMKRRTSNRTLEVTAFPELVGLRAHEIEHFLCVMHRYL
jgi:hypothetical protein